MPGRTSSNMLAPTVVERPRVLSSPPPGILSPNLGAVNQRSDAIFHGISARVVSWSIPLTPKESLSAVRPGTLPWRSPREQFRAYGELRIVPSDQNVPMLEVRKETFFRLMPNSTCWCVDGQSKFIIPVGTTIYRIELPHDGSENEERVADFIQTLRQHIKYEETACPFRRSFDGEHQAENADSPGPRRRLINDQGRLVSREHYDVNNAKPSSTPVSPNDAYRTFAITPDSSPSRPFMERISSTQTSSSARDTRNFTAPAVLNVYEVPETDSHANVAASISRAELSMPPETQTHDLENNPIESEDAHKLVPHEGSSLETRPSQEPYQDFPVIQRGSPADIMTWNDSEDSKEAKLKGYDEVHGLSNSTKPAVETSVVKIDEITDSLDELGNVANDTGTESAPKEPMTRDLSSSDRKVTLREVDAEAESDSPKEASQVNPDVSILVAEPRDHGTTRAANSSKSRDSSKGSPRKPSYSELDLYDDDEVPRLGFFSHTLNLLMGPPSGVISVLFTLASRVRNLSSAPGMGIGGMRSGGLGLGYGSATWTAGNPRIPGRWEDSEEDGNDNYGGNEDAVDDYGVPLGNSDAARKRRAEWGMTQTSPDKSATESQTASIVNTRHMDENVD